jgi:ABC-type nitrate/sulfonate/bicarbonate transport system permease component
MSFVRVYLAKLPDWHLIVVEMATPFAWKMLNGINRVDSNMIELLKTLGTSKIIIHR